MPETLEMVVRHTRPEDISKVMELYKQFPDPNIVLHSKNEHEKAAEDKHHFLVEHEARIVASTIMVPVGTDYLEGGNDLVDTELRGYGLQALLIKVRAAHIAVMSSARSLVMAADPRKNEASIRNIRKSKLSLWEDCDESFLVHCENCTKRPDIGRTCCCDFYILRRHEHRQLINEFLSDLTSGAVILRSKYEKKLIKAFIKIQAVLEFEEALEEFSNGVAP